MSKPSKTGSLTTAAINFLLMIGFNSWQNNTVGVWDPTKKLYRKPKAHVKGAPDVEAVDWYGRYVGVEIKSGEDRLSSDQAIFAAETIARFGTYCIISSIDDLIKSLQYYGYKINQNGYVISRIKTVTLQQTQTQTGDIISIPNIPNANKIPKLSILDKARISVCAKGNIGVQLLNVVLGNYKERIL